MNCHLDMLNFYLVKWKKVSKLVEARGKIHSSTEAAALEIRKERSYLETRKGPSEEWEDSKSKYHFWSELSHEGWRI